jgi:hypothetical protein
LIDTGADISLFGYSIALGLGLDMDALPVVSITGVGGLVREARMVRVRLLLLNDSELNVEAEIAFAPDVEQTHGNLIGLDVLEHFDFISHAERLGYLGRHVP